MRPRRFPNHGYNRGYHQPRQNIALLLLASQLFQVGFTRIPPVTLVTILGQIAIFLKLIPLKYGWPRIGEICISSNFITHDYDFKRLVTATFFHLDDWHLYYNMVSFLWKGMKLERGYGSGYFAYLLAVFTVLTNIVTVLLGIAAAEFLGSPDYTRQCAAGFSGVIFALKVLTSHNSDGTEYVMGFPVPGPFVCWAELLLIQLIAPGTSFIGHLAGIIVGLLYVKGPLKGLMDQFLPSQPSYTYRSGTTGTGDNTSFNWGPFSSGTNQGWGSGTYPSYQSGTSGTGYNNGYGTGSGRSRTNARQEGQARRDNYDAYSGGLSEEEQMRRAMEESRRDFHESIPSSRSVPSPTIPAARPSARPQAPSAPPTAPSAPPTAPSAPPTAPSAPPYIPRTDPPDYSGIPGNRLYPDLRDTVPGPTSGSSSTLNTEEVRRRRLDKFS